MRSNNEALILVVANTVRASLVRGSEAASDSQFSMSVGESTPEDDNGVASVSKMESEFIELLIFSSMTSWDGRGAVASLEEEAPITSQVVYGRGWNGVTILPHGCWESWVLVLPSIAWNAPSMGGTRDDISARSSQSTGSHYKSCAPSKFGKPEPLWTTLVLRYRSPSDSQSLSGRFYHCVSATMRIADDWEMCSNTNLTVSKNRESSYLKSRG